MVHRRPVYIYLFNVPSFSSRHFNKIKRTSRLGRLLALSLEILYMCQPIWDPCRTRSHSPYRYQKGAHMDIWVSYRLLDTECWLGGFVIFMGVQWRIQSGFGGGGGRLIPTAHLPFFKYPMIMK